jgi:hypothetical protein
MSRAALIRRSNETIRPMQSTGLATAQKAWLGSHVMKK